MKTFSLTPQDAWFFRDGRPYNHGESNQADVRSMFPPPARTLTGAIRAALARNNGWDGRHRGWSDDVTAALGTSADDLGKLQFSGPFLLHKGQDGKEHALWPMPRHLVGLAAAGKWEPKAFLRPGDKATLTDQGKLRLPEIAASPQRGHKPNESAWITSDGMRDVLAGNLPPSASIYSPSQLWRWESRVGLKRNNVTRQVDEGDLYSPSFVRLTQGTSLGIGFSGVDALAHGLPSLFPLGGESRLAQCDRSPSGFLPTMPEFKPQADKVSFTITLLTPGDFDAIGPWLPSEVSVISACLGKPFPIGGWDSLENKPLPLRPFQLPGSVWFCESSSRDFASIQALHGAWLGEKSTTAHGFGQILIGHWPQSTH